MFTTHLLVPCTPKQFASYVTKITGNECEAGEQGGACVTVISHVIIGLTVWDDDIEDISILSHECLHGAIGVLTLRGINITDATEEVLCYLQGSLLKACLRELGLR